MAEVLAKSFVINTNGLKRKQAQPLEGFKAALIAADRSFYDALSGEQIWLLLNVKRHHRQKVWSVTSSTWTTLHRFTTTTLTQFQCWPTKNTSKVTLSFYLRFAASLSSQSCKDFMVDTYQVYLVRHYWQMLSCWCYRCWMTKSTKLLQAALPTQHGCPYWSQQRRRVASRSRSER